MIRAARMLLVAGVLGACGKEDEEPTDEGGGWEDLTDLAEVEGTWTTTLGTGGFVGPDGAAWGSATFEVTFVPGAEIVEFVELYTNPDGGFVSAWKTTSDAVIPEPSFLELTRRVAVQGEPANDGSGEVEFPGSGGALNDASIYPVRRKGQVLQWGQALYAAE